MGNKTILPSQSGANGKFLKSNGTVAEFAAIAQTDVTGLATKLTDVDSQLADVDAQLAQNAQLFIEKNLIVEKDILPHDATEWEFGSLSSGVETVTNIRLRSVDFVELDAGATYHFDFSNTNFSILLDYYNTFGTWITKSAYQAVDANLTIPANVSKCRFVMQPLGFTMGPDVATEIAKLALTIKRVDGSDAKKTLRVMQFNLGNWNYGLAAGVPVPDVAAKLIEWREFMAAYNADVVCLNELQSNFDAAGAITSYDAVFKSSYPNYYTFDFLSGFASKYDITNKAKIALTNLQGDIPRYIQRGYLTINGDSINPITICLLTTHFAPGVTAEAIAARDVQRQELMAIMASEPYFIACGDFNGYADTTAYDAFTAAGYNIANCGWFGVHFTSPYTVPQYVQDNIITSANIRIDKVVIGDNVTSDHLPIIADVTVY